jgi:16S rRNA (adenine1518-N6/adenine1519-N6)-dimethyltransferase
MEAHNFKKQFGQNFLKDDHYAKILVDSAGITPEDTVIEIGAGQGMVTTELAKLAGKVYALDIDTELKGLLVKKFKNSPNVLVMNQDILTWEFLKEIGDKPYKVVSSLPYNVAKKILKIFLTSVNQPKIISVIIQKEVADNYLAEAPKATFLGTFGQIYAVPAFVEDIGHDAFFPEPKVESTIITFTPHKPSASKPKELIAFIKSGYSNPRKMLANNLANYLHLPKSEIQEAMKECDIDINFRPENLSLENWQALFSNLIP